MRAATTTQRDIAALERRIHHEVDERRDRYIADLSALLRFETVSGDERDRPARRDDPAFQDAWRFVRHEAERLGLRYRDIDGAAALIEWPGTDPDAPTIGIATHLDVVPAVDDWQQPPFAGAVVDGEIWGRGAQDDKGPLAAVLAAIDVLQRLDMRPVRGIVLIIGSFEETEDWPDMDRLLETETVPDEVIVPDGGFPLCIGEKGIATIEWSSDWPRAAPGDGPLHFERLEGGVRANVVPARAEVAFSARRHEANHAESLLEGAALRLERVTPRTDCEVVRLEEDPARDDVRLLVRFNGRAAHAALPEHGHNAALDALAFLGLVPGIPEPIHKTASFLDEMTRRSDGTGVGVDADHPFMGASTLNLGRVGLDNAGFHAWCNIRFPIGLTPKDVERRFRDATRNAPRPIQTRMIGRPQAPFLIDDERHQAFLRPLETAYEAVTGHPARHLAIAGTTYAKLFPLAVGYGPVDLTRHEPVLVHQVDERVSVSRYLENIRIYCLALLLLSDAHARAS